MDTPHDIHRAALREVECWLTGEFVRSPNLPVIPTHHIGPGIPTDDPVYRAMLSYLFHWALETLHYHLRHEELRAALLKVAARHGKLVEAAPALPR